MLRDLRHAARLLLHSKGWTLVVVLSLALGIGANTAIFSAVNGLVLRTLPVHDPGSLVRLRWVGDELGTDFSEYGYTEKENGRNAHPTFSYPMYLELLKANRTLDDVFASAPQGQMNVVVDGRAELASTMVATGNYFQALRVPAAIGRVFTPADDSPDAAPVAVISHGYWQRRFGGDPGVVGRVLQMNNVPVTVIGVTPRTFTGVQNVVSDAPDVMLPLALDPQFNGAPPVRAATGPLAQPAAPAAPRLAKATTWWLQLMGRLKPGVSAEQVHGNLAGVFQETAKSGWLAFFNGLPASERSLQEYQQDLTKLPQLTVSPGGRGIYDVNADTYRSMSLLTVVVALVLLIVCANVANLLLSRAAGRQREISVRLSMGATRGRLVRQLLTESVLLAAIGGALGVLVAYWGRQLLPANLATTAGLDWRVLLFIGGLTLVTGIVFGLAPALRASGLDVAATMKEGARTVSGRSRLGKGLLVLQVAVSLVVIVGAGLFLRTLRNLRQVNVGFRTENLLLVPVNPTMNRYDQPRITALNGQLLERLQGVPGVSGVALSNPPLLSGGISTTRIWIEGRARPDDRNSIHRMVISPGFFDTLGIPLVAGRAFTPRDDQPAPKVAIINETAVRKYFANRSPLGEHIGNAFETAGQMEIVGVVRDTHYDSVRDQPPATMYQPFTQVRLGGTTFELRTAGDPAPIVPAVREAIRQVDPNLPILQISTQTEQVEGRLRQEKVFARAYLLFGGLALLLASIGLFGLMSYNVARRTNEIGIRMALGARREDVVRMVMRESLVLVVFGVALGAAAALASGRFVASVLFGLAPSDSLTLAAAIGIMVMVSAIAGYLPARAASKVDPMIALRYE